MCLTIRDQGLRQTQLDTSDQKLMLSCKPKVTQVTQIGGFKHAYLISRVGSRHIIHNHSQVIFFARSLSTWKVIGLGACLLALGMTSCPFQAPFYFLDPPALMPVLDEFGNTIPDKVSSMKLVSLL